MTARRRQQDHRCAALEERIADATEKEQDYCETVGGGWNVSDRHGYAREPSTSTTSIPSGRTPTRLDRKMLGCIQEILGENGQQDPFRPIQNGGCLLTQNLEFADTVAIDHQ